MVIVRGCIHVCSITNLLLRPVKSLCDTTTCDSQIPFCFQNVHCCVTRSKEEKAVSSFARQIHWFSLLILKRKIILSLWHFSDKVPYLYTSPVENFCSSYDYARDYCVDKTAYKVSLQHCYTPRKELEMLVEGRLKSLMNCTYQCETRIQPFCDQNRNLLAF